MNITQEYKKKKTHYLINTCRHTNTRIKGKKKCKIVGTDIPQRNAKHTYKTKTNTHREGHSE